MTRFPFWRTRELPAFIAARLAQPFAWGLNDCCLLAADAVEAITGVDIAAEFRGRYRSQRGAFSAIRKVTGGATVADAVAYCAAKHGMPELEYPLMARCGDLVVLRDGEQLIAGVIGHDG